MDKQERGECSRRSQFTEDEKPLKKARYVWEVKGKHHLKDSLKNNNMTITNNNTIPQNGIITTKNDTICKETTSDNIQNEPGHSKSSGECEIADNLNCCRESFLARTEAILNNEMVSISDDEEEKKQHPKPSIPISLVSRAPQDPDYYIRKWQARQIARGFVDNTINTVLETWNNPPFDAVDFVEDCRNDGRVEDDAILMAIQSHGLVTGSRDCPLDGIGVASRGRNTDGGSCSDVIQPDIAQFTMDNFQNFCREHEEESRQESSSLDTNSMNSASPVNHDLEMGDPMDFLNAAVSVAIQKKGLSYG